MANRSQDSIYDYITAPSKYILYMGYIIFLLFIPFQKVLVKYIGANEKLLYLDEIVSVLFFVFIVLVLLVSGRVKRKISYFLLCLVLFSYAGVISGLSQGNKLIITLLGEFDYIKNFIYVVGCYYLFSNYKYLKRLYKILLRFAIILAIVAIIQEVAFFLGFDVRSLFVPFTITRFGFLRTPSLLGHPNIFGLYILLFFTLHLFTTRKLFTLSNVFLLMGIFLSFSRFVWVSGVLIVIIFTLRSKKLIYKLVGFAIIISFIISVLPFIYTKTHKELLSQDYFRGYALYKSMEIWNDNKLLGVGPGMFGGVISLKFNSPVYDKYNFSEHWLTFMEGFNSIDQFWSQLLAETGLVGFYCFMTLLIVLYIIPKRISFVVEDQFLKGMLSGLSKIPIVLFFYLFGSGLNMTAFLVTYTSLLGISIGVAKDENSTHK